MGFLLYIFLRKSSTTINKLTKHGTHNNICNTVKRALNRIAAMHVAI